MRIRDLMTPSPITVQPDTAVETIAQLMSDYHINGVPVVNDDNQLLGIVTAEDLLHRAAVERLEPRESIWKENFWVSYFSSKGTKPSKAEGHTAAELMSSDVRSLGPDESPTQAIKLMIDYHIKSLPVVENNKVIGIIARSDLLNHLQTFENPLKRTD